MSCSPLSTVIVVLPLCLVVLPGCGKKEDSRQHLRREGIIERIDLDRSEVTLRYYSEKHKIETTVTGKATPETEILINGVLSSLDQLRVGERVSVIGWVRGHGDKREVVADRVNVNRAETVRRQPSERTDHQTGPQDTPEPQ